MNLLTRSCNDVYVVTGPLYLPTQTSQGYVLQHPMIGEHLPCTMLVVRSAGSLTMSLSVFPGVKFFPDVLLRSEECWSAIACLSWAKQQEANQECVCAGQPPRMVAVPTHFFKVVLAERGDSSSAERADAPSDAILGAFVLPNAPLPPDIPLTAFSVPLEPLEEAAGRCLPLFWC